jgi:hypothetical protein
MGKMWIVICTCTLALVSAAAFAATPGAEPLSREALTAILGPSSVAVSPSCAGAESTLAGKVVFAARKPGLGAGTKSICSAEANCASGTVSCNGNSVCVSVDRDCLNCQQGFVKCDGVTTPCPTACNCSVYTGTNRFCCQCACTGDCWSCCRCDGGSGGLCGIQCG